ncbi:FAD binding domain-containing protein [Aspergillus karnatakaensis]|uniref:putative phenol monooxygenase n=1 Tax=Aspergillus karnatakaensis TaxID=1810916 RepID=UPI003CCE2F58
MPVFTEFSASSRELRVLPSFAPPLPRLSPAFTKSTTSSNSQSQSQSQPQTQSQSQFSEPEKYEVVIIGAGPAGLMLNLLLARYGLSDDSLLCVDTKPGTLKSGQADGLQPRTLEILKSLGLADEILNDGCHMEEVAFWNPTGKTEGDVIERTSIVPDVSVPARFQHEVTIHQGRIERILETDLLRYSKRGVLRNTRLVDVRIDEEGDAEFPVIADIETEEEGKEKVRRTVRSKYLVGADGAHSNVRRCMGLSLEGESLDHIWGVVDLVIDTDFPDIRRRCAIHSPAGSVMVIPRERIVTGDYLTRLYVQVPEIEIEAGDDRKAKEGAKARRAQVTLEGIFQHAADAFKPYYIKPKQDGTVDWWAAYQIGQRVSGKFTVKDSKGINRVFIAGDACHTHSPKAGQGMNVSMMDSYNLAWKLIYSIHGLTPGPLETAKQDPVLDTYHLERHTIAQQLIDFDRAFSSMFSGKIGTEDGVESLTHEQFLEVFSTGNGFTSGCGIEYPENITVEKSTAVNPIRGTDYLQGILRPGRRLLNARVRRFADGNKRDLQDDFLSTGRFRILVLTSSDLLIPNGQSAKALSLLSTLISQFPSSVIEQTVIHPQLDKDTKTFMWRDLPAEIKKHSEMRFYSGYELSDDVYKIYGVDEAEGAITVVRPDGYVGVVAALDDVSTVEGYLGSVLRKI